MATHKAFLIDGTAFCYRAFYAIRSLSTSAGRPTNAVYGFAMMLQALREKAQPDYLAVAFDVGKPTFRHRQFADYKIQRKPMPDPLIEQLPLVKSLLAAYRIPVFEREGYEGEDVLATIARRIAGKTIEVFLVTGDKDALQLVNSHIRVYNPHREAILDAAAVKARYGVGPERMVDLMALMGDDIDNIPGVRGIGEKTATELLQAFGSVETLYRRLEDLPSAARRQALAQARDQVELARELARIHADVPLEVELEELRAQEPDRRALRALFRDLEFKRLLSALDAQAPEGPTRTVRAHQVEGDRAVKDLVDRLQGAPSVALAAHPVSLELASADGGVVLAFATSAREAWVLQVDRRTRETAAGKRLAGWLGASQAAKIGHDLKTAMHELARVGLPLDGIAGDTMIAAYLVNPSRTSQTLSDLADELLDVRLQAGDDPQGMAQAACAIVELHQRLLEELERRQVTALYRNLELPLVAVLYRMEAAGVALDVSCLNGLHASMEGRLRALTEELYALAGCTFNVNSPKQLAQVLFERLQLPVIKRAKTGPSTDSDVLRQLASRHPLPQRLIEYRELAKLTSTYVEALPKLVNPETGRLHTSFNQAATATGRLSSSDPNLQNIPIKTDLGRSIRKAFIPSRPGGFLVAADYSQVELRILAHLSGDEQLCEAFRRGHDIHRYTASLIYGLPEDEIQPEQRGAMKAVNFGIVYGMSSHGLSKELGIPYEEAQAFIDAYFERYPKVRRYLDEQIAGAKRDGFVQTMLGRRRYIPELQSPDQAVRQFGERIAVNAPIQGTAADLIKRAMVQLAERLARDGMESRMILQVHDELVFDAPRGEQPALARVVREIMEQAIALAVPLTVTMKAGPNWFDLTPV